MSLQSWLQNGQLTSHQATVAEVRGLLGVVDRELADASVAGLSDDGRFTHAYDAAFSLAEAQANEDLRLWVMRSRQLLDNPTKYRNRLCWRGPGFETRGQPANLVRSFSGSFRTHAIRYWREMKERLEEPS